MRTQSPDTSPEAERVLIELLRAAPAWRKIRMVDDTNRFVRDAALAGLRERYPIDSPEKIKRRFAELWLGHDLAERAFGSFPSDRPVIQS